MQKKKDTVPIPKEMKNGKISVPSVDIAKNEILIEKIPEDEPISSPLMAMMVAFRNWLRPKLADSVIYGIKDVLPRFQVYRSPFLDLFFSVASFCGSEDFYVLLFPLLCWNHSAELSLLILTLFGINVYTSNFLKNIMRLPRPSTPKMDARIVLDNHGFGWPSMHSMNAVSLPIFLLTHLSGYLWPWQWTSTIWMQYIFAFCWLAWIIGSRIYLCVHTPIDVYYGISLGLGTLTLYTKYGLVSVHWLLYNPNGFLAISVATLFCVGLLLIHPYPLNKTLAETSGLLGTEYGFLVGSWIRMNLVKGQYVPLIGCTTTQWLTQRVLESIGGLLFCLGIDYFVKTTVRNYFGKLFGNEIIGLTIAKFIGYTVTTVFISIVYPFLWENFVSNELCVYNI